MTLPSAGTVYVKLTATLAYGGETGTKTFLITVKSLKAQNDEPRHGGQVPAGQQVHAEPGPRYGYEPLHLCGKLSEPK